MFLINAFKSGHTIPNHLPESLLKSAFDNTTVPPSTQNQTTYTNVSPPSPQPTVVNSPKPEPKETNQNKGNENTNTKDEDWIITSDEKVTYEKLFLATDTDHDGYVTGNEARTLFTRSTISLIELAKIYELADMDSDSKLSKVEFFIAMKLITKRSSGAPLPEILPSPIYTSLGISPPTTKNFLTVNVPTEDSNEENKFEEQKKKAQELTVLIEDYNIKIGKVNEQNQQINKDIDVMVKQKNGLEDAYRKIVREKSNLQKEIRIRDQKIRQLEEKLMTIEAKLIQTEAKLGIKSSGIDPITELNQKLTEALNKLSYEEDELKKALVRAEKSEAIVEKMKNQPPKPIEKQTWEDDEEDDIVEIQYQDNEKQHNPFI